MRNVGIIVNTGKDEKLEVTSSVIKWLENNNCRPFVEQCIADLLDRPDLEESNNRLYKESEFIITLGGDGTLLSAAKDIKENEIPILGINMGRLGFLTEVEKSCMFDALDKVLSGNYTIDNRLMLESIINTNEEVIGPFYSLNDAYITGGIQSRPVTMDVSVGDNFLNTYVADGLLVSTPTGSTAYSLSAGGPILSPELNAMLITPICAHSLNARSIVVSDKDIISIKISDNCHDVYFNSDSQKGCRLKNKDNVIIKKAPFVTKLIKTSGISFYELLRLKLKER